MAASPDRWHTGSTATAEAGGLAAVAGMRLGADTGPAMGALSAAFLDGLQLCLIVAASLALFAALIAAVLLRHPQQAPPPAARAADHGAHQDAQTSVESEPGSVPVDARVRGWSQAPGSGISGLAADGDALVHDGASGADLYGRVRGATGEAVEGAIPGGASGHQYGQAPRAGRRAGDAR